MRKRIAAAGLAALLALAAAACGTTSNSGSSSSNSSSSSSSSSSSNKTIKAAWIYVGSADDAGWTAAHDAGRKYAQQQLGSKLQTTIKENVPEGPQVKQVIDDLVRDGNKIIFATSFGYQDAMVAAAKQYPDVKFEQATGSKLAPNLAEYYGAGEDSNYLAGMAAGAASKSGTLGYVAPFPIPEVIRDINAWTLGAQTTHPGAKVKVVWTNTWFDPSKESKAAQALTSAGADVLGQNQDSPATGQVAKTAGIKWTGYDSDQQRFAPNAWLTGAIYNWGPYYTKRIQAVLDGTWKSGSYYGSIADGFTNIAPFGSSVTKATQSKINAKRDAIKSGSFYEFQGPLTDQAGKVRVPKGSKLSLNDILGMTWFVKGVIGNPKGS
jgi:basic membrane protein A and related proteins